MASCQMNLVTIQTPKAISHAYG